MTPDELRAQDTAQFRASLAYTAKQPEFVRSDMTLVHLQHLVSSPYLSMDECLSAIYGTPKIFWEIECSEPVKWSRFIELFRVLLLEGKRTIHAPAVSMAIAGAMLDAYRENADFFVGDVAALEHAQYGWQVKSDTLKIHVRKAGLWLMSKPKRAHLVPANFRAFIDAPASGAPRKSVNMTATRKTEIIGFICNRHPREPAASQRAAVVEQFGDVTETAWRDIRKSLPESAKLKRGEKFQTRCK